MGNSDRSHSDISFSSGSGDGRSDVSGGGGNGSSSGGGSGPGRSDGSDSGPGSRCSSSGVESVTSRRVYGRSGTGNDRSSQSSGVGWRCH